MVDSWTCPDCKRLFKNKNQWHSCVRVSLDAHFKGKPPEVRKLFDQMMREIKAFGHMKVEAVKTAINLGTSTHFAMVYIKKGGILIAFSLPRILKSNRVQKTQKVTPTLHEHWVKITKPEDIDEQLLSWLKEAYSLQLDQTHC